MTRLPNKVALVIGGASGIGLAIAQVFAAEGADVYLTGRRQQNLDRALEHIREEHFDRHIGLNVRSLLVAVQAALPIMGNGATVVLVGSVAGGRGTAGFGVYGASKGAVRALARTWTSELAPRGIRANVVSPGPIDTALFAAVSDDARDALTTAIPLGRLGCWESGMRGSAARSNHLPVARRAETDRAHTATHRGVPRWFIDGKHAGRGENQAGGCAGPQSRSRPSSIHFRGYTLNT